VAAQDEPTVQAVIDEMLALEEAMTICGNGLPKNSSNEVIAPHVSEDLVGPEFDLVVKEGLLEGVGEVADGGEVDDSVKAEPMQTEASGAKGGAVCTETEDGGEADTEQKEVGCFPTVVLVLCCTYKEDGESGLMTRTENSFCNALSYCPTRLALQVDRGGGGTNKADESDDDDVGDQKKVRFDCVLLPRLPWHCYCFAFDDPCDMFLLEPVSIAFPENRSHR
jgi:hypothetical protein